MYYPAGPHRRNLLGLAPVLGGVLLVIALPLGMMLLDRPRPIPLHAVPDPPNVPVVVRSHPSLPDMPSVVGREAAPRPIVPLPDAPHPPVPLSAVPPAHPRRAAGDTDAGKSSINRAPAGSAPVEGSAGSVGPGPEDADSRPIPLAPAATVAPGPALQTAWPGQSLPQTGSHDFDAYCRWLQSAENERDRLRFYSRNADLRFSASGSAIPGPVLTRPDGSAPNAPSAGHSPPRGVQEALEAVRSFGRRVQRQKPTVPPECASLDRYYSAALDEETTRTASLLDAAAQGSRDRLATLRRAGVAEVDRNLDQAESELERAWSGRGVRPPFHLRTGERASLLGELTGPGGLR